MSYTVQVSQLEVQDNDYTLLSSSYDWVWMFLRVHWRGGEVKKWLNQVQAHKTQLKT